MMQFAKQFSAYDIHWVVDAYNRCTKAPYTYMLFDSTQTIHELCRIRSHILPGEDLAPRVWARKEDIDQHLAQVRKAELEEQVVKADN